MTVAAEVKKRAWTAFAPASPYMAAGVCSGSDGTDLEVFALHMVRQMPRINLAGMGSGSNSFNRICWGKESEDSKEYSLGIIAGAMGRRIHLWNPYDLVQRNLRSNPFETLSNRGNLVRGLEFNAHSANLLASGADDAIYIWDLKSLSHPHCIAVESETQGKVSFLSWNKIDRHVLASTSHTGVTSIWDTRVRKQVTRFSDDFRGTVLQWNPYRDHELIVASDEAPSLKVWDIKKLGRPIKEFVGHTKGVIAMSWCPHDHSYLITCAKDNSTIYWDAINGKILVQYPNNQYFDVHWHPSIPQVISASSHAKFGVYKVQFNVEVVDLEDERTRNIGRDYINSNFILPFGRSAIHTGRKETQRSAKFYRKKAESMLLKYELAIGKEQMKASLQQDSQTTPFSAPEAATSPIKARSQQLQSKGDLLPQATVDAPQRLLQFAVRDAGATSRPSKLSRESLLNRLSSVVSAPVDDSRPPQRTQPVARVPVAMAAVKAVAAKDARRVRSSGSVLDRLGRASDVSDTSNKLEGIEDEIAANVGQGRTYNDKRGHLGPYDIRSDHAQAYDENMSAWQSEPRLEIDAEPDEEKYGVLVQTQGAVKISQTGTSDQYKVEDLIINQDSTSYKADEVTDKATDKAWNTRDQSVVTDKVTVKISQTGTPDQYKVEDLIINKDSTSDKVTDKAWSTRDQSVIMSNTPYKPANASSNLNTWISPQYQETRESAGAGSRKDAQASEATISTSSAHMIENKNHVVSANETAKIEASLQKDSQTTLSSAPGSYPANWPMEDADSRTIFVSNVHFAATKDSLLRHFNKFGEVLKVILTDAATGQPKRSAYVEFMKSEAADSALSLDGTSFMSRLLKVVRKNAAHPEAAVKGSYQCLPRVQNKSE